MITVARKPVEKYKTLVIDPPWMLCTGGSKTLNPKNYYPLQTQEEIVETVQRWLEEYPIAEEAHCYIWSINSFGTGRSRGLLDAVDLCEKIGFNPVTLLVWTKPNGIPTPYGQRNTEVCLFGARWRKGHHKRVMYKPTHDDDSVVGEGLVSSVDFIYAPRREHSRKPEEFYELIERRSNAPYLEFYSRTERFNWTCVGNQVGMF